jgi:hypothetical protein
VAELEPGVFGLTMQSASQASAARLGVERARAFCARQQRAFDPVRTEIGDRDYRIAFRCPRPPEPQPLELDIEPAPAPAAPAMLEIPGFRQPPGLL